MRLIPTHCDACSRTSLVGEDAIVNGHASCAECGRRARSLPGESYALGDVALFDELRATLEQAGITPASAVVLAAELGARKSREPGRGLKRLSQRVPALGLLELIVPGGASAMRKAEGMLAVLLDGLASTRAQSSPMTSPA